MSQASVLSGDLHLDEAMHGFALLFNVGRFINRALYPKKACSLIRSLTPDE
jgi:hypothetical protein